MTIAIACILAAALLPYVTIAAAKYHPTFDNRSPREWEARLEGWRKRATFAHENHFEAFGPFAAGVVVAELARAPQGTIDAIALLFIATRIAYTAFYLANNAALRSTVWVVGFGCMVALYAVAIAAR